jgi:hypothetical protein
MKKEVYRVYPIRIPYIDSNYIEKFEKIAEDINPKAEVKKEDDVNKEETILTLTFFDAISYDQFHKLAIERKVKIALSS